MTLFILTQIRLFLFKKTAHLNVGESFELQCFQSRFAETIKMVKIKYQNM